MDGLITGRTEKPVETITQARFVVAYTPPGAVAPGLIAKAAQRVRAGGAFLQITAHPTVTLIAQAAHDLGGVPGRGVHASGLVGEDALGEADAAVVAVLRAGLALAGDTVVAVEAFTGAGLAVADALVGALDPWMQIVRVYDV